MGTVKYSSKGRLVFQILYEMQYMVTYIKISIVLFSLHPDGDFKIFDDSFWIRKLANLFAK